MRFSYTGYISLAPDTGEPVPVFRPEVQIRVHGAGSSRNLRGLVDTGADNVILPESVAHALAIRMYPAEGPAARAFGGQEMRLSFADVALELVHADGSTRWQTRAFFVADDANEEPVILGHQGFLEFFSALFVGEDYQLDLAPNRHLPRW